MLTKTDCRRLRILYALLGIGCLAVLCGAPVVVISISAMPGAVYFVYTLYAYILEQINFTKSLME